jgi:type IV pilus assembly protein PilC
MPTFAYRARDDAGQLIEGSLEADNELSLVNRLRERGYVPTLINRQVQAPSVGDQIRALSPVPYRDMVLFTRQLSTMIGAGLPLISALDVASRQTESRRLREVLREMSEAVEAGSTLAGAMELHPRVFTELYVNIIHAGEVGGALDRVLNYLADYLERQAEIVERIKTAAFYPLIVLVAAAGAGAFALFVVLPVIFQLFTIVKIPLPWPTRVLMFVGGIGQHYWYMIIPIAVTLVLAVIVAIRTKRGRQFMDRVVLDAPIIGPLVLKASTGRLARMLAMLIRAGIPVVQAMEITARAVGNSLVAAAVWAAAETVKEGLPIAFALSRSPLFAPMVYHMVGVGEQTGTVEDILDRIANFYDAEVDHAIRRTASIIEPAMIVVVGAVVAFVAVAMLLPLWQLIGALH